MVELSPHCLPEENRLLHVQTEEAAIKNWYSNATLFWRSRISLSFTMYSRRLLSVTVSDFLQTIWKTNTFEKWLHLYF